MADENEYIPAMLTLTDVSGTHIMDSVGVRLKGNSSYFHPGVKKSFKIDFNKFIPGQNYDGLKKLNFSNGFKDPTCMREKLFFDACLDAGVPAPRASFANVTFNGEAWGFYTVVEQSTINFSIGPSKKTVATCSKPATTLVEVVAPVEGAAETTRPRIWWITAPILRCTQIATCSRPTKTSTTGAI